MTVRLTLCATAADHRRETVFGDGSPIEHGLCDVDFVEAALRPNTVIVHAPSARCAQTAAALGRESVPELALRDIDYGTWRGRTVGDVADADPYGLSAWLKDPDAAPHGGESVRQLCVRTQRWLRSLAPVSARTLVIAEPTAVRALLVNAMSLPATAFWHLPASTPVSLAWRDGGWNVESRSARVIRSREPAERSARWRG
ncbi:histidine phosphatase family protein [Streptomyces mirabilis]|uniref:histidine phosphatase family protein n=1 Tax=Streptomyces mirabilis TaxID=68239 RepID=UPI0036C83A7D